MSSILTLTVKYYPNVPCTPFATAISIREDKIRITIRAGGHTPSGNTQPATSGVTLPFFMRLYTGKLYKSVVFGMIKSVEGFET